MPRWLPCNHQFVNTLASRRPDILSTQGLTRLDPAGLDTVVDISGDHLSGATDNYTEVGWLGFKKVPNPVTCVLKDWRLHCSIFLDH